MKYCSRLGISFKEIFVSIVDEKRRIIKEEVVANESNEIAERLLSYGKEYEVIGIKNG